MVDRAMRTARKRRLIPQPEGADKGEETPKGVKARRRAATAGPRRPDTQSGKGSPKAGRSAEVERGESISQALMKGAAMVPQSPVSGTLRGLLGGASVGMDIDVALEGYRQRKKEETAANAAMQMDQPMVSPPTPSNVPPEVLSEEGPVASALRGKRRRRPGEQVT